MDMGMVVPLTEARKKIFQIAEDIQKTNNHYTFTVKGRVKVVLMSFAEYASWRETEDILAEWPDIIQDAKQLEKDIKSGAYKKYITLEELLVKKGYLDKKILKNKNVVSSKTHGKGTKTTR